jgi:hypothetical protein
MAHWILCCLLLLTFSISDYVPANAGMSLHGSAGLPPGNCPKGSSVPNDGCDALYTAGLQGASQWSNCLTDTACAAGAGQTYATRAPWNIAGIDFPVGVPQSVVTAGYKDPAVDPLPANCSYTNTTGSLVTCSFSNNLDFSGFEMCPIGSHGATNIDIKGNRTGTSKVWKNHFCGSTNGAGGAQVNFENGSGDAEFSNNTVAGGCTNSSCTLSFVVSLNSSGNRTAHYNYITGINSRPFSASASGGTVSSTDFRWNFINGFQYVINGIHGEVLIDTMAQSGTPTTQAITTYGYNTFILPNGVQGGQITTIIYMSGGASPIGPPTWTQTVIDGNTLINNVGADGQAASAIIDFQNGQFINAQITNNYFDATGNGRYIRADCINSAFTGVIASDGTLTVSARNTSNGLLVANQPAGQNSKLYYAGAIQNIETLTQLTGTPGDNGAYTTDAPGAVSSQSMNGYGGLHTAVFPNSVTISGNKDMVSGATISNPFNFKVGCLVPPVSPP